MDNTTYLAGTHQGLPILKLIFRFCRVVGRRTCFWLQRSQCLRPDGFALPKHKTGWQTTSRRSSTSWTDLCESRASIQCLPGRTSL